MRKLRFSEGDKLVSYKRYGEKNKPINAVIKRVDTNANDGRVYYTEGDDGTKKWWFANELEQEFKRPDDANAVSTGKETDTDAEPDDDAKSDEND